METATVDTVSHSFIRVLQELGIDLPSPPKLPRMAGPDTIRTLIEYLIACGFTPSEIGKIAWRHPRVLNHRKEVIENVFKAFARYGYDAGEVRQMIVGFPTILNTTPDRIEEIIEIHQYLDVDPRRNPGRFAVSPKLYRGRIAYLNTLAQDIGIWAIFLSNGQFFQTFGKTREEMVALDPGREACRGKRLP